MKDRQEKLFDAITLIEEEVIDDADRFRELEGELVKQRWKARIRWRIIVILVLLTGFVCFMLLGGSSGQPDPTAFGKVEEFDGEEPISVTGIGCELSAMFAESNCLMRCYAVGKGPDLTALKDNSKIKKLAVYRSHVPKSSDENYQMLKAWAKDLSFRAQEQLGILLDYDLSKATLFGEPYDKGHPVTDQPDHLYALELDLTYAGNKLTLCCRSCGQVTEFVLKGIGDLYEIWSKTEAVIAEKASEEEIIQTVSPIIDFANSLTGTSYSMDDCRIYDHDEKNIGLHVNGWSVSGSEISREVLRQGTQMQMMSMQFVRQEGGMDYELERVTIDKDYRVYLGEYELISPDEAKERFSQGIYYPGESSSSGEKMDLSSCDLVQIEYSDMLSEYVIPYYAFYKKMGQKQFEVSEGLFPETDGLTDEYAVIYVPAIDVE